MSETKLNWSSATVKEAALSVELDGEVSKDWRHKFEDTVRLLGDGDWGQVKVKKQTVSVADVTPGDEDKVRFFLESVVEQANATLQAREEAEHPDEDESDPDSEPSGPDADMTERFRSFSDTAESASESVSDAG